MQLKYKLYAGPVWYNFIQGSIGNNADADVEIVNQPPPILKRVSISSLLIGALVSLSLTYVLMYLLKLNDRVWSSLFNLI